MTSSRLSIISFFLVVLFVSLLAVPRTSFAAPCNFLKWLFSFSGGISRCDTTNDLEVKEVLERATAPAKVTPPVRPAIPVPAAPAPASVAPAIRIVPPGARQSADTAHDVPPAQDFGDEAPESPVQSFGGDVVAPASTPVDAGSWWDLLVPPSAPASAPAPVNPSDNSYLVRLPNGQWIDSTNALIEPTQPPAPVENRIPVPVNIVRDSSGNAWTDSSGNPVTYGSAPAEINPGTSVSPFTGFWNGLKSIFGGNAEPPASAPEIYNSTRDYEGGMYKGVPIGTGIDEGNDFNPNMESYIQENLSQTTDVGIQDSGGANVNTNTGVTNMDTTFAPLQDGPGSVQAQFYDSQTDSWTPMAPAGYENWWDRLNGFFNYTAPTRQFSTAEPAPISLGNRSLAASALGAFLGQ